MSELMAVFQKEGNYPFKYPVDPKIPDSQKIVFDMRYLEPMDRSGLTELDVSFESADDEKERRSVRVNVLEQGNKKIKACVRGWANMKMRDKKGNVHDVEFEVGKLLALKELLFKDDEGVTKKFDVRLDLIKHIDKENDLALGEMQE